MFPIPSPLVPAPAGALFAEGESKEAAQYTTGLYATLVAAAADTRAGRPHKYWFSNDLKVGSIKGLGPCGEGADSGLLWLVPPQPPGHTAASRGRP